MEITFIERKEEAKGVYSFIFEGKHKYTAGQHQDIFIGSEKRTFSYSSSPTEDTLMFTTRNTGSAFKENLLKLKRGDKATIKGPFGMFTLREDEEEEKDTAMICGGIGITPMRSMIKYAADRKLKKKITLIYFNKTPEDTAFLHELQVLEAKNRNFKFIPVMTRPNESKTKWNGITGHFSKEMFAELIGNAENKLFYVSGPPAAVSDIVSVLMKSKVRTENIITEEFMGY